MEQLLSLVRIPFCLTPTPTHGPPQQLPLPHRGVSLRAHEDEADSKREHARVVRAQLRLVQSQQPVHNGLCQLGVARANVDLAKGNGGDSSNLQRFVVQRWRQELCHNVVHCSGIRQPKAHHRRHPEQLNLAANIVCQKGRGGRREGGRRDEG